MCDYLFIALYPCCGLLSGAHAAPQCCDARRDYATYRHTYDSLTVVLLSTSLVGRRGHSAKSGTHFSICIFVYMVLKWYKKKEPSDSALNYMSLVLVLNSPQYWLPQHYLRQNIFPRCLVSFAFSSKHIFCILPTPYIGILVNSTTLRSDKRDGFKTTIANNWFNIFTNSKSM